jgi:hypothetical protein
MTSLAEQHSKLHKPTIASSTHPLHLLLSPSSLPHLWLANLRFYNTEGITQTHNISNIVAQEGTPEGYLPDQNLTQEFEVFPKASTSGNESIDIGAGRDSHDNDVDFLISGLLRLESIMSNILHGAEA